MKYKFAVIGIANQDLLLAAKGILYELFPNAEKSVRYGNTSWSRSRDPIVVTVEDDDSVILQYFDHDEILRRVDALSVLELNYVARRLRHEKERARETPQEPAIYWTQPTGAYGVPPMPRRPVEGVFDDGIPE